MIGKAIAVCREYAKSGWESGEHENGEGVGLLPSQMP